MRRWVFPQARRFGHEKGDKWAQSRPSLNATRLQIKRAGFSEVFSNCATRPMTEKEQKQRVETEPDKGDTG